MFAAGSTIPPKALLKPALLREPHGKMFLKISFAPFAASARTSSPKSKTSVKKRAPHTSCMRDFLCAGE